MAHLIDKSAVAEIKDLYEDIDKCIGDLVLARSKHDQRGISDAHWKMETLMVNTQQVLSYILQHLEVKEVDNVWHDANEIPKGAGDKQILVQFTDYHASIHEIDDWEYLDNQTKWAYLKDLT